MPLVLSKIDKMLEISFQIFYQNPVHDWFKLSDIWNKKFGKCTKFFVILVVSM